MIIKYIFISVYPIEISYLRIKLGIQCLIKFNYHTYRKLSDDFLVYFHV